MADLFVQTQDASTENQILYSEQQGSTPRGGVVARIPGPPPPGASTLPFVELADDLRGIMPSEGAAYVTLGALIVGIGGGPWIGAPTAAPGTYVDNLGTVLVPSSGPGSDGSRAWRRDFDGDVNVNWFGAYQGHPDGFACTAGLLAAAALGKMLYLPSGGSPLFYAATQPIIVTAGIRGDGVVPGGNGTVLSAVFPMACTLKVQGAQQQVSNIYVNGNLQAENAILLESAALSVFENVIGNYSKGSGIMYGLGNNIGCTWRNSLCRNNGTIYSTGTTGAASAGAVSVSISGAADLTTLGFVATSSFVTFDEEEAAAALAGVLPLCHEVSALSPTIIDFYPPLAYPLTSSAYKLIRGSGVEISPSGTNGSSSFWGCDQSDNKAAGLSDAGLFGASVFGGVRANNRMGRITGKRTIALLTVTPTDLGCFTETNTHGDFVWAYSSAGAVAPGGTAYRAPPAMVAFSGSELPAFLANYQLTNIVPGTALSIFTWNCQSRLTRFLSAAAVTAQIGANAISPWQPGAAIEFSVEGAGAVTVDPIGATVFAPQGFTFVSGERFLLTNTGVDLWTLQRTAGA